MNDMIYVTIWASESVPENTQLSINMTALNDAFVASRQHLGQMTDILAHRLHVTRGDAARIAEEYFSQFGE